MKRYIWPVFGFAAACLSVWVLYGDLRDMSLASLRDSLVAIALYDWLLAVGATVLAYAALAGYDHIALLYLRKHVNWRFVVLCSFTTYALSHNIGAPLLSGLVVRYRAYRSRGLTAAEVGVLAALCSFTFVLGTLFLSGVVFVLRPDIGQNFSSILPVPSFSFAGALLLLLVLAYCVGSIVGLRSMRLGSLKLHYPRPSIVVRQLVISSLELVGAASIIYFALPEAGNPGFVTVLGIFLVSFSAALLSHAPGGVGVLELVFMLGLPDMPSEQILAALLVFRLLYLLVPLGLAVLVIFGFERSQLLHGRD